MSIYDTLNPVQQEAVFHTDGPLLILAGAGSGKTRVLTHRIAYLIEEKGVNPWNIMAITFTNKAADEMRERVDKLVGFGSESIWVATFHSTCVRILRRHIDFLGYDTNFTIYDSDDQKTLMRQVLKKLDLDPKMYKDRAMVSAVSAAKNDMISPEEMMRRAQRTEEYRQITVAKIYAEYQKQLKSNNALDFDDLLVKTVELFRENGEVLEYYQNRFRYIMVDEYQDTNTVQFQFIQLLARKYQNLCVVGDDDQSIYKFRGANIFNILNFEQEFPDTRVIKLEQNYRSTQNILDAANEVIRHNKGRKEKKLWTDHGAGELVKFRQFDNGYDEAEAVVMDVLKLVNAGECSYKDCAVLYRTNAQSRAFEEACVSHNVPYRLIGGVNFYQRQEIKDILAYLKTIDNGADDLAVQRILNVPKRGIGQTSVGRVTAYADEHELSFFDALQAAEQIASLGKAAGKIRSFVNTIMVFRAQADYLPVHELIESVLETSGYLEELEANEEEEKALQRRENLEELISKAADYEDSAEAPTLSGFLEEVALVADIDSLDQNADRMILMTLHGAKGLEFPRVYLCGLEDGLFPSYMSIESDDASDLEEERRLCYVGITRAMEHLTLTAARLRTVRGETRYNMVSRFLQEIPPLLLDQKENLTYRQWSGYQDGKEEKRRKQESSVSSFGVGKAAGAGFGGSPSESFGTKTYGKPSPTAFDLPKKSPVTPASSIGKTFTVQKMDKLDYQVGDRVKHIKFGPGTVEKIEDAKKDFEVTVNFDRCGVRSMFASFAKLKKI